MISGIVAIDNNGGIGYENRMPWPFLSEDMKWFKTLTTNNVVVMGYNTWISLPKKLSNRVNAIVSKKIINGADHVYLSPDVAISSLEFLYPTKNIFVIGGQQLYDTSIDFVDTFYITHIHAKYNCDKFFDIEKIKLNFTEHTTQKIVESTNDTPGYTIKEYKKIICNNT